MNIQDVLDDAKSYISEVVLSEGFQACGVRSMGIMQTRQTEHSSCSIVEPLIGLVLQGSKSVQYGTQRVRYNAGDVIVIGHALPMVSAMVDATQDEPYIALYVGIDMQSIRSVYSDMGGTSANDTGPALKAGPANIEVIDSIGRLFKLRSDPVAEQTLGAAALCEVYFRVLRSDTGSALKHIIHADSKANQIAKAIVHIRNEYRATIRASDLAAISGMSPSVFYDTFKRITANSPLQFQKDLRLTEAHHLLQQTSTPISEIAHKVGYESAAQFSREFSKKFGIPPRKIAALSVAENT